MKSTITVLLALVALASCSVPKYSYYFDHYNYNAGKKQAQPTKEIDALAMDPQLLTASVTEQPVVFSEVAAESATVVKKTYLQMTKMERKTLRHHLKKEIKNNIKVLKRSGIESANASNAMDHDLKLAAIFGAVGLVALIISGNVFYIIGGIALLIGVVFFVKWIIRQ